MDADLAEQLRRFTRGELQGDELRQLEARLDVDEAARLALVALLAPEAAPTVASQSAPAVTLEHALTLGSELGRGGMAVVSVGLQHDLQREVAVKRARPGLETGDEVLVQEARLLGALEHPAIVPVHFLAEDERGRPLAVLKRIEGEPWSALIRAPELVESRFRRAPLEWHLRVLSTVCDALAYAHARGVIHRDVKPGNVMVGAFGEVYLTDWGLGGLLRRDPTERLPCVLDTPGAGTPAYMAPEQLRGEVLSGATDVWLVGACLYEVLYGAPPFPGRTGRAATPSDPLTCDFAPGPRADVLAVAQRAMQPEPGARWASVRALQEALEACLRHTDSEKLSQRARRLEQSALAAAAREQPDEAERLARESVVMLGAALDLWPENDPARESSARLCTLRVEWALAAQQLELAETVLREHRAVPPALAQRVAEAVAHRKLLQAQARALDPGIGQRTRLPFVLGVVVMMVVFNGARLLWPALYASRWSLAVSSVAFLVGFAAWGWWHRALLRSSRLNTQLANLVLLTTVAQISTRTTAAVLGWSRADALTVDLSVVALALLLGASAFHARMALGALVCFVGQVLALRFRELAEPLFGVTTVTALTVVAFGLRSWGRDTRK